MKNVYIETYGCAANQNDSEIMMGLLAKAGYNITIDKKMADVIIINTCVVKETTENKLQHIIKEMDDYCKKNKKMLVIAGCMPASELNNLRKLTDANVVGCNTHDIVNVIKNGEDIVDDSKDKTGLARIPKSKTIFIEQISQGCMNECSFCMTRLARGKLRSYDDDNIVKDIAAAKNDGYKEFWLTSQDNGCYGFDKDTNLAELLNKITSSINGKYFLRIGMMNPQHAKKILNELIDAYKNDKVFKFIHIPVQSGSNQILRKMKRGHTAEDFVHCVNEFRKAFPDITVWTDIIVGFPDETEEDFQATLSLLEKTKPDFVNVSRYSVRPNTAGAEMKQLITEVKKERSAAAAKLTKQLAFEANKKWINWTGDVLVDEWNQKNATAIGRNYAYKPIAIGNDRKLIGSFKKVTVLDAKETCLLSE